MTLEDILNEFVSDLKSIDLPQWMNTKSVSSKLYSSDLFSNIRLSHINIENKFYAESLVIYPHKQYDAPIFGTEYMNICNKVYFGAIDFHPLSNKKEYQQRYIETYLDSFPDKKIITSKFYDLNNFFSNYLWVKKQKKDLINEYQILLKCYLHQYIKCINCSDKKKCNSELVHLQYNQHMGENDPVAGILKSYFGEEFSKKYIKEFLFPY